MRAAIALLCALGVAPPALALATWVVDPLPLRARLEAGDFAALEQVFEDARKAGDADRTSALFGTFRDLSPAQDRAIDAWREQDPESPVAMLAHGYRSLGRARESRGEGSAREVTEQGWDGMRANLGAAAEAAQQVLRRDPRQMDAYVLLLQIAQLTGSQADGDRIHAVAIEVDPTHYGVWRSWLSGKKRRWGGSYAATAEGAERAQAWTARNPRLRLLLGRPDWDRADDLSDAGRFSEAIAAYDAALGHGDDARLLADRAKTQWKSGDAEGALTTLDRALLMDPFEPEAHIARALALARGGAFDDAVEATARVVELVPSSPRYRAHHDRMQKWQEDPTRYSRDMAPPPQAPSLFQQARRFLYYHYFHTALAALAVWIGWYAMQLRRRRQDEEPSPVREEAVAAAAARPDEPFARPGAVSSLPRVGVLLLRAYLWFQVVVHALQYSVELSSTANVAMWADAPVSFLALLGALGFAHGWRLGGPTPWRIWTFVYPLWNIWIEFDVNGGTLEQWPTWGFLHLTLLPVYAALYLYGYRSQALWDGGQPGPGWRVESPTGGSRRTAGTASPAG